MRLRALLVSTAAWTFGAVSVVAAQYGSDGFPPTISVVQKEGFTRIANLGHAPLPADAPQPDSNPRSFSGSWFHDQVADSRVELDMYGNPLPFGEKGRRIRDSRVKATYVDHVPYANASAECLPPGQPWQIDLNFPFQIFQSKDVLTFVFQEYHGIWTIRMNQPHRRTGPDQYMGDSVGHWEGNTLVVDTIGYKRALWLDIDGTPASRNAHLTFRIRRINYGMPELEVVTMVNDPQMYTAPWSMVRTYAWRPDMTEFVEYNCEYQLGTSAGISRYGLVPEPEVE
jgi:hypothetical protein